MPNPQQLITDNINIWTAAIKKRGSQGRGSSKKIELHGIKKLRELILELAVRGLLVPQNPSDEPANVLLEKIAAEKEQLIKDGKIKKQKPLPEIGEDEKPFELPKGWEWSRVGGVGIGATGKTPKTSMAECFGGDIPFIGPGQITPSGRLLEPEKTLTEVGIGYSTEAIVGDVLMVCIGGSIGKAVISDKRVSFNQQINSLRPVISLPSYLHMALTTLTFYKQVLDKSTGSATPIINRMKWEELTLPLPPEAEQPRIVAKVDELMALCDQLEQQTEDSLTAHQTLVETLLNSLLDAAQTYPGHASDVSHDIAGDLKDAGSSHKNKTNSDPFQQAWQRIWDNFDVLFVTEHSIDQLKQTILQLAIMGKLVPQNENDEPASVLLEKIAAEKEQLIKDGKIKKQKPLPEISEDEKPFELPKGWTYTRLDDLCATVSSGTTPSKSELNETSGIPFLKVYNIQNQEIEFDQRTLFVTENTHLGKLKRSVLYPGDVVMNLVGPPLGKVAIIPNTYPEWNCNQNIVCFRPMEIKLNKYIYTYLKAHTFLDYIILVGSAGQDFISGTKCRAIVSPMPPLEEGLRIVAKVDELMALCDTLKERIRESQTTQLHLADAMAEQALNE